ncbi:hypothetical protein ZEAMMB73_Zm00001d029569 [Zea mays]|uniref:Uncharacterized protein n=1 Tax=Zea mays TaxID=4577 RepID=A0A1D6K624_MAIZE|nr:hypothetical protein ZEAMMB73_Zm00001d029569 [Zea mays]
MPLLADGRSPRAIRRLPSPARNPFHLRPQRSPMCQILLGRAPTAGATPPRATTCGEWKVRGAIKGGAKVIGGGGIFNLFDWKRKSRKKLFSNSPEGSKLVKRSEETLLSGCLHLLDELKTLANDCQHREMSLEVVPDDGGWWRLGPLLLQV